MRSSPPPAAEACDGGAGVLVIYRSYGKENNKGRPSYYSKPLALLSFLRAAEQVPSARLLFVNDGPMPENRLALMRAAGEVQTLDSVGMRRSYLSGLKMAAVSDGPDDELIYFSEDDYLYRPEALKALEDAQTLDADYFSLFGSTPQRPIHEQDYDAVWLPPGWRGIGPLEAEGRSWYRTVSTASTFGGRRRAFREDYRIFAQGLLGHRQGYSDHETCIVYQGYRPYNAKELISALTLKTSGTRKSRFKEAARVPFQLGMNLRSLRRPSRRRVLLVPDPNLATHLEIEWLASGTDWEQVARETWDWARTRGLTPEATR